MKAILISIKPKWIAKILNGEKTIEIRRTAPKCELPIEVCIYCTKGNRYLIDRLVVSNGKYEAITLNDMHNPNQTANITPESKCVLNGKVVAKFTLRKVDTIHSLYPDPPYLGYMTNEDAKELLKRSCLSDAELTCYLGFSNGYSWHISDLEIFDEPKEISEFGLKKAPQSWCYVEEKE